MFRTNERDVLIASGEPGRLSTVERAHLGALMTDSRQMRLSYWSRLVSAAPRVYLDRTTGDGIAVGEYEQVLEVFEFAGDTPVSPSTAVDQSWALHALGRHEEEWTVVSELLEQNPEARFLANHAVWALGALGDEESVDQIRDILAARLIDVGGFNRGVRLSTRAIDELRIHGHDDAAERVAEEAVLRLKTFLQAQGGRPRAGMPELLVAAGELDEAEALVRAILQQAPPDLSNEAELRWELARILALQGRHDDALEIADSLDGDQPQLGWTTSRQRMRLHTALGELELAARYAERAMASGMPHRYLRGPHCALLRDQPIFRRLLRGYPTC